MDIKNFIGKAKYDPDGQIIWSESNGQLRMIADIRGLSAIKMAFMESSDDDGLDNIFDIQDQMGRFIADAINEKISKE